MNGSLFVYINKFGIIMLMFHYVYYYNVHIIIIYIIRLYFTAILTQWSSQDISPQVISRQHEHLILTV